MSLRYCVKTAKHILELFFTLDSPIHCRFLWSNHSSKETGGYHEYCVFSASK